MRTPGVEVTVGKFFWEAQVVVVSVRAQQLGLGFQLKKVLNNVKHKYKDKVKYRDKDKVKYKVKVKYNMYYTKSNTKTNTKVHVV